MEIKGIIFDFGGTLDTGGNHWSKVIKECWGKAGVAADDALLKEAYVYGEKELERTARILPSHDFNDMMNIKLNLELGYLASTGNFPPAMVEEKAQEIAGYCYEIAREKISEAKDVLTKLSQTYSLALVSNYYGNLKTVITRLGIESLFKVVIDSKVEGVRKPDAQIFTLALKQLGLKPEETLVVGDSISNDIMPAKKLGCATLLLKGNHWDGEDIINKDIKEIDSLQDIISFLA